MLNKLWTKLKLFSGWSWLIIIIGSASWSLTMVKSGLVNSYGMGFWGPNGHDGVWHIALARSLARGSWEIPVFAGELIKNYHIGFDLLLAILHKITFIPIHTLYFQVLPPLLSLAIGMLTYLFVVEWKKSKSSAIWATFFVYFGGSLSWIITFIREGKLDGESMFWSQQAISTLINPPFALSLIFLLIGLNLLLKGIRLKTATIMFIATFIFGILVQIKVYAGILAVGGLFVAGIHQILKRKGISIIKVATGALIISILIFIPLDNSGGSSLVFKPFWFLETMMSDSDRLLWPRFAEAIQNYRLSGNYIKLILAYSTAFIIFLFGNLGTRIIEVFYVSRSIKHLKRLGYIDIFIYSVIIAGVIIPMLFVQKGTPWNTIQFFYYSLFYSGILAGVWFGSWLNKISTALRFLAVTIILLFTLPTAYGTLRHHYLPSRPPAMISNEELAALKFLEKQPLGVVLTFPFDKSAAKKAESNPPRPLYLYESSAYVSAFSNKPVYLEDEVNLEITGYDWRYRRLVVEDYLMNRGWIPFPEDVMYLYFIKPLNHYFRISGGMEPIFTNSEVDIYRVRN